MEPTKKALFESKMDATSLQKLAAINNDQVDEFVAYAIELCEPDSVFVGDDSDMDASYCRMRAIDGQEESQLATNGHTVHFDGYFDQARKKDVTKYLVPADETLDPNLNQVEREEGLAEIEGMQRGAYKGRLMYVRFFCLGATDSAFAIPCLQITDSAYVVHSEELLYRRGYEEFKRQSAADPNFEFFRYRHATGEVDERMTSKNYEDNRVYMDHTRNTVLSVNTQYAGNTVGLKKLSLRLAIRKADREGWLAEHMFIMRCNGPKGRETYLAGAYPSACGKTATAMLPGENIVGDDLAYFKVIDGEFRACNVEAGIFGIITDVNADDDPVIWDVLHRPGEVVFGNLCVKDGKPYWLGMSEETPVAGANYASDEWTEGMVGPDGNVTTLSHKNARYTVQMRDLENADPDWDNKQGLPIGGIIYGGRDSDTTVPVEESKSFADGIVLKAATLESETTSATLGQEGVRRIDPMANLDFISYPLGEYVQNNLDFVKGMKAEPKVFSTNYFLLDENKKFCTSKLAKKVWLHWAEGRIHGDFEAYETPTGFIPKYADLKKLFSSLLDEDYLESEYTYQFTFRCDKWTAKLDRAAAWYQDMDPNTPQSVKDVWEKEKAHIEAAKAKYGANIEPGAYKG